MKKRMSSNVSIDDFRPTFGWDKAIMDAENELLALRQRAARLSRAIDVFRANKEEGVAWPAQPGADD
jgi:hypothetical protein